MALEKTKKNRRNETGKGEWRGGGEGGKKNAQRRASSKAKGDDFSGERKLIHSPGGDDSLQGAGKGGGHSGIRAEKKPTVRRRKNKRVAVVKGRLLGRRPK